MDEIGYKYLEQAFKICYQVLTSSASSYNGLQYLYMTLIIGAFQGIGCGIVILLTYTSLIKQSSIIIERHPETIFKVFIRAVVVYFFVVNCTSYFCDGFISGLNLLAKTVFNSVGIDGTNFGDYLQNIGGSASTTTETSSFLDWLVEAFGGLCDEIVGTVIQIIYLVTMITTSIDMIVSVFTRFVKIYIYGCTMPIGISMFADQNFSMYGKNYARAYIGALLEGVTISIAIVMFCAFVQTGIVSNAMATVSSTKSFTYIIYIAMLNVLKMTVKQTDMITGKLFGLQ